MLDLPELLTVVSAVTKSPGVFLPIINDIDMMAIIVGMIINNLFRMYCFIAEGSGARWVNYTFVFLLESKIAEPYIQDESYLTSHF